MTREERIAKIKAQRHQEDVEVAEHLQKCQDACYHLDGNGYWALNITHNYPDGLPRAICPMCLLVIHPQHHESGAPNQYWVVAEHPLYEVVRWMEKRDYDLAKLEQEQEFIYTVDHLLGEGAKFLTKSDWDYQLAQGKIQQDFETNTYQYKKRAVIQ